jgi:hypothetical protein
MKAMLRDMLRKFFKPEPQPKPYPESRPYTSSPGVRRRRAIPNPIRRCYVPLAVMEATDRFMCGPKVERYVWWGGYFTKDGEAQVATAICADSPTRYGTIHLTAAQLQVMQSKLRSLDQVLIAELHTHPPGAGGQNDIDAAHPAATYRGFVTIVVPDFAQPRFYDLSQCYVYEYLDNLRWREFPDQEIRERFVIEEPGVNVRV